MLQRLVIGWPVCPVLVLFGGVCALSGAGFASRWLAACVLAFQLVVLLGLLGGFGCVRVLVGLWTCFRLVAFWPCLVFLIK